MPISEDEANSIHIFLAERLGLHVKIGKRRYERGDLDLYLWKCRDCGATVKGTPQGNDEVLICPRCLNRDE